MAINNVVIEGRMTKDPELRATSDGRSVTRFSVAVDRAYQKEGQREADFIGCVAFGKTAEFVDKYFKKGKGVSVIGNIRTDSYTNSKGERVFTTTVVADRVFFPVAPPKNDSADRPEEEQSSIPEGFEMLTDDDVPF